MNSLVCYLWQGLYYAVNVYTLLLLVYAVVSWIPDLRRGRWVYYLASVIEPVLQPLRRVIPPLGGLDLAFLIVLLVLQLFVRPELWSLASSCVAM
ncbi:MAG TPA: YggT family protein [Candidatus Dormibacteraeota bacterium]|nr:YggT family protein [Candidatus Dormibacteraeota bacterium]